VLLSVFNLLLYAQQEAHKDKINKNM